MRLCGPVNGRVKDDNAGDYDDDECGVVMRGDRPTTS